MLRPRSAACKKQDRKKRDSLRSISTERITKELLNPPIYNEDSLAKLKDNDSRLSNYESHELDEEPDIYSFLKDYPLDDFAIRNETADLKENSPNSEYTKPRHMRHNAVYLPQVKRDRTHVKPNTSQASTSILNSTQIPSLKQNQSSTQTIIEKKEVSNSFNCTSLKLAMNKYFETEKQLKDIFKSEDVRKFKIFDTSIPHIKPKIHSKSPKSKRLKTDCGFSFEQADVVMDELLNNTEIHKPKHWNQILKTLKDKPKILMNLIPVKKLHVIRTPKARHSKLDPSAIYGSTPRNRTFVSTRSSGVRKFSSNSRNTSLNGTHNPELNRSQRVHQKHGTRERVKRSLSSSPQMSTLMDTAVSLTPIQFETFHDINSDKDLTDDWSHSYLNHNIKRGLNEFNPENKPEIMARIDVERAISKITRDSEKLAVLHAKGLATLQHLLIELLGTKEDALRFSERFGEANCVQVRSLLAKCLDLFKVREKTRDLLQKIHKREKMIKLLKKCTDKQRCKKILIEIYKSGKSLRNEIKAWEDNPNIPFDKFIYKGKVYIEVMAEEIVKLQGSIENYLNEDQDYSNIYKTFS